MSISKRYPRVFRFAPLLIGLLLIGCASSQVTNSSGHYIAKAKIDQVKYSRNLDYCAGGCSTGFKAVPKGENRIAIQVTGNSPWVTIGKLSPFRVFKKYSVNIRTYWENNTKHYCAELWRRYDPAGPFNSDTTKVKIDTFCPKLKPVSDDAPISQVTNNSGVLLKKVKIGLIDFTENLDYCAEGCSTGFKTVAVDDNKVSLETTDSVVKTLTDRLGPFEMGFKYAVNIIMNEEDQFCAELWRRDNTGPYFNADTTKVRLEWHCFE